VIGVAVAAMAGAAGNGSTPRALRVDGRRRTVAPTTTSTTTTTTTTAAPPPEPVTTAAPAASTQSLPAPPRDTAPAEPQPPPERVIRVFTYSVATYGPVSDVGTLDAFVEQVYADPRGWSRANVEFQRVPSGGDFTIVLANANTVPNYDPVCDPTYSCQSGRFVVINDDRWTTGSSNWPGPLGAYRQMVVNHETGHFLGLGHAFCSGPGDPAPVMQQQSIDMQGCATNSWPLDWEIDAVRR
jgi:hypothetical protein